MSDNAARALYVLVVSAIVFVFMLANGAPTWALWLAALVFLLA